MKCHKCLKEDALANFLSRESVETFRTPSRPGANHSGSHHFHHPSEQPTPRASCLGIARFWPFSRGFRYLASSLESLWFEEIIRGASVTLTFTLAPRTSLEKTLRVSPGQSQT